MTKKEFDKMKWNSSILIDCPDGEGKELLAVDFEDDTVNVRLAPRLNSWYGYKEIGIYEGKAEKKVSKGLPDFQFAPPPPKKLTQYQKKKLRSL